MPALVSVLQTQHPEDLNRDLQDMARERGLSGLSNDRAPESPSKARGRAGAGGPRSRRSVYLGQAEKEIMRSGGYSWVGDIRAAKKERMAQVDEDGVDVLIAEIRNIHRQDLF